MPGGNEEMRDIMALVERFAAVGLSAEPRREAEALRDPLRVQAGPDGNLPAWPATGDAVNGDGPPLLTDLGDLVFKLRAHTEGDDGDRALGFEEGMQRAADMVENLMRRHGDARGPVDPGDGELRDPPGSED